MFFQHVSNCVKIVQNSVEVKRIKLKCKHEKMVLGQLPRGQFPPGQLPQGNLTPRLLPSDNCPPKIASLVIAPG